LISWQLLVRQLKSRTTKHVGAKSVTNPVKFGAERGKTKAIFTL